MTTRSALGVWTLALLAAVGAVAIVLTSDHTPDRLATIVLAAPIGLVFVASGLIARGRRPDNRTGSLLVATGLTWFLGALGAADESVLFSAGLLLSTLSTGVLAHLLLAFPTGKLERRFDRLLIGAGYVLVLAGPAAIAAVDSDVDDCGKGTCPDNVVAVTDNAALADAFRLVFIVVAVVLLVALIVRLVQRWRTASPALRRALAPVYFTGVGFTVVLAALTALSAFSSELGERLNWITLAALLMIPFAFLYGLLRPRFSAATRQLVAELSEKRHPREIQDVLRRVLRDPGLQIGHRVDADAYVDVDGAPLELPAADDARMVTSIAADEVIVHDAALRDQPELDEVLDATHIALERGISLRSLEASERRASALLAAIPDNVYRVSEDGTFLEARSSRGSASYPPGVVYPGVPEASIIGRRVQDVMPAIAHHVMHGVETALRTDTTPTIEFAVETPIGMRDLEVRFARSGPAETVGIVRDVTERKTQERELERLAGEQTALSRVALAVAVDPGADRIFGVVIEEVALLLDADSASLVRFDPRDETRATIVGRWTKPSLDVRERGPAVELDGGPLTRVRTTGRAARGRVDDADVSPRLAERLRAINITSLVAAPIEVSGGLWGAVVLSLTGDASFPPDAEARIAQFANLVAVALANAEARRELATLAEEQSALSRVAVAVATEEEPEHIFNLVTEEAARLLGARWASTVRYLEDADEVVVVGDWHLGEDRELELGAQFPLQGGAITQVKETGQPARLQYVLAPDPNPREMIAAPIVVSGRLWGATTISMPAPDTFPPDAEARLGKFTSLVAVALANAEAHEQLRSSRARIVEAGDAERRRLERNLHDGAQQRLVSLALGLRLAQAKLPDDPDAANELLNRASDELALGLEELRELARGIHPAILSDRGLTPALEALADRAALPVELNGLPSTRLPPAIEAAAFYVVAESLTNVSKYAAASAARVDLARDDGLLVVEVSDDGVGGADSAKGSGLRGLSDRVEALGGRLRVSSEPGRGTTIRAELPVSI